MALRVAGSLGWQVDEVIKRVDIYPAPVAMEVSDGTSIAGHKLGVLIETVARGSGGKDARHASLGNGLDVEVYKDYSSEADRKRASQPFAE